MNMPTHRRGTATLNVHLGNALVNIAGTYPRLLDAILEMVQNAIDAGAKRIDVRVDYSERDKRPGSGPKPDVSVIDDGAGVTIGQFNDALSHVCETQKSEDKLGRFGIGLISPLGKCAKFAFMSCGPSLPEERLNQYVVWSFETDAIRQRHSTINAPYVFQPHLLHVSDQHRISPRHGRFGGKQPTVVWWRSRMDLFELAPDSEIGHVRIDELKREILNRFSVAMARRKVKIHLEVIDRGAKPQVEDFVAQGYLGTPLPVVTIVNKHAGRVRFELYIAPRAKTGRRSGVVNVGEEGNDFRFPIRSVFSKDLAQAIDPDAIQALREGTLEGEITAEKVETHPSRGSFITNDASAGFLDAIDEWFRQHGRKLIEEAREARRDERLQVVGQNVMDRFRHMLPKLPDLQRVFDSVRVGSIGVGHADVQSVIGAQVTTSVSTDGDGGKPPGSGSEKEGKSSGGGRERGTPPKEKLNHRPFTVVGPRGRARTLVKDSSIGLQLAYDGMESSMQLWQLETDLILTLRFNQRHPLWMECEKSGDSALVELQMFVILSALTLELQPKPMRDAQRAVIDEITTSHVRGWILSEARVGVPKRSKDKAKAKSAKPAAVPAAV